MTTNRRSLLLGGLALLGLPARARAQGQNQWTKLKGDEGQPVGNARLPVELVSQVDAMPGRIQVGSKAPDVVLAEFYDYNCPWCRKAAQDIGALVENDPDLRISLIGNPILSPGSKQAAAVEAAVQNLSGDEAAFRFHARMFAEPGRADLAKAVRIAAEATGRPAADFERVSASREAQAQVADQLRLAANLGFIATPTFVLGGLGVFGYPGPRSTAKMITALRSCGEVACR
ncbi:DsbA family protein [Alsobacter sp. SYSU BS001988]